MTMTEKQKRFADEYLIDLNGTRAYKQAYPRVKKDTVASVNASRMLRNAKVKAYIDERLEKMQSEKTANAQEVIEYLSSVMRGEQQEQTIIGIGEGAQGITEIDVGANQRLKAAELLGRRYALFTDKQQVENIKPPTFNDDIGGILNE